MSLNIIGNKVTLGLVFAFLVVLSPTTYAKTLYVDGTSGNDAITWADNSPSTPWRTIGRAAWGSTSRNSPNSSQAARAGDSVIIAAGTYVSTLDTGQGRWDVLYNPVNSGASGNSITFVANGTVALRAPTWGGPIIGARLVNYIVWSGPFLIDEQYIDTEPDTGPVVLSASTGSGIDGATILGVGSLWADNHVGVRIEPCNQCFVRNTTIDHFTSSQSPGSRNGAAIMLYDANDTVIENNELSNCGSGIYIKGTTQNRIQEGTIVRYNLIRNMLSFGIIVKNTHGGRIYQNLIQGNPIAFLIGGSALVYDHPVNNVIANNTVDGGGTGIGVMYNGVWENMTLRNNIWTNLSRAHASDSAADPGDASNENGVYFGVTGTFATFSGNSYTLDSWKQSFRQDQARPASISADPRFIDSSRNDFRLLPDSPARAIGVDLLDVDNDGNTTDEIPAGAFVSGNEIIGTGSTRPAPPSGLTVN